LKKNEKQLSKLIISETIYILKVKTKLDAQHLMRMKTISKKIKIVIEI